MFTKRHYEAIAKVINEMVSDNENTIELVVYRLEQVFKKDNPFFDERRFRKEVFRGQHRA